jgi:putative Ca2+/H+ antiporter (TMEM165/GDT1 family)
VVAVAGWLEILLAAATLQLLVLPGEKVQMIIAGLSTKYNPYVVVAGAGVAFAGWTALEIVFGEALQRALPGVYLDAITGGLFLLFGVLLVYSAVTLDRADTAEAGATADGDDGGPGTLAAERRTDGGVVAGSRAAALDQRLPERYRGFFPAFSISAFGEFGDKTQVVTIGLAAQYGAHPAIWVGEMLVIIPVSLVTALVSHRLSHLFTAERRRWVYLASAGLFLLFAADVAAQYLLGTGFLPV